MVKKLIALATSLTLISFFAVSLMSCEKPKEETPVQAVEKWLALIDEGKYSESWVGLADLFKKNVKKEEWADDLNRFRKPLGKLLKRELQHDTKSSEEQVGEYLIFQYEASFENKKLTTEAVSVVRDKDGKWRILGYFIDVT
ncbi:MAG TPA: DUF4019 domain-containing protein [Nitrospirae bacterium]|nr:DUF4019 domain-containing protein [Nitrospirota bacterium]HDK80936.1 DUF4019 domain-containing protein [Nitrospirota bacterium]